MLVQATPTATTPEVVQVTGVKINPTPQGAEVILETSSGEQLQVLTSSYGRTFVANIVNTQLALPEKKAFRALDPATGITAVTVTQQTASSIRVSVTGKTAVPTARVIQNEDTLALSLSAPVDTTAQPPQSPPIQPPPAVSELVQPETPDQPREITPAAVKPQQPAESAPGEEEIEIVVTGEREDGYSVPNASTATRTDTPVRDIPASIQVVPRQVIEDRGITNAANALETTSGVNAGIYGGTVAQPRIRGFQSADSFFVNGSRRGRLGFDNPTADNIERIEVLRGPSSVLFGQGSPGGIVNIVTRRPLEDPYYNLNFQAGSFEQIRPSFDISGPLNSDKTLLYRFIGSYTRERSFVEFANSEIYFLAPSLEWRISPNTTLGLDLEFIDSSITSLTCGIPAVGRGVADIPRSRALCESGDFGDPFGKDDVQRYNLSARLDHQFSQDWSVRNTFFFRTNNVRRASPNPFAFNEVTGELRRRPFTSDDSINGFSNNLDVVGTFMTGSIEHKLLAGFEYTREDIFRRFFSGGTYASLNIFAPVYSNERFRFYSFPFNTRRDQPSTTYAFYLQDQISFTDNLILVLGGRYDIYEQKTINRITDVSSEQTFYVFSPRVGLVYRPAEFVSLYASFTEGFEPSSAVLANGSDPPPQQSTQYEVGAKFEFGKLAATLSYFDITKTNIPTTDLNNPGRGFSVITGEVKSRGFEFDISGEILPGWNITASYAYTDAFVSEDNAPPFGNLGNRFVFTPRHSAALWTTYEIQEGIVQGLGFGLGLFYVDEREADLANSFAVPSYLRTDASIFYRRDNWRAQINFQNLLNTEYFVGTNDWSLD